jgi:hypothetical protein
VRYYEIPIAVQDRAKASGDGQTVACRCGRGRLDVAGAAAGLATREGLFGTVALDQRAWTLAGLLRSRPPR